MRHLEDLVKVLDAIVLDDSIEPGKRVFEWRRLHPDGPLNIRAAAELLGVGVFAVERWQKYRRGVRATKRAGPPRPSLRLHVENVIGIPPGHWDPDPGVPRREGVFRLTRNVSAGEVRRAFAFDPKLDRFPTDAEGAYAIGVTPSTAVALREREGIQR